MKTTLQSCYTNTTRQFPSPFTPKNLFPAVTQAVSKNKNAIGYIGFGYLDKSLKKLNVGGLVATPATALSHQWPIARELYLFTNGTPTAETKQLIDFIIVPQKGQKLVQEVGFIPLAKK